jgi:C4-dicarboxylate-specific signal transduction histidine kinase
MDSSPHQQKYFFETVDNGLKIMAIILVTVVLTSAAVYLSFSLVEQVKRNQLNQAAQSYTQQLRQKIQAQEEQLQLAASSTTDESSIRFKEHAKRLMEKNPSISLIEIRDESAGLIARQESIQLRESWTAESRRQLAPAVLLNFLRTIEQQKIYWAYGHSPDGVNAPEMIVPTHHSKRAWIIRINTDQWKADATGIDLPRNIQLTLSEQPIDDLDPLQSVAVPLGLSGTKTHLVFSRKIAPLNHLSLNQIEEQKVDGISVLIAALGLCLCALLASYVRDAKRYKDARALIANQQAALLKQNQISNLAEISTTLAHELNQPLATITNYVASCQMRIKSMGFEDSIVRNALNNALKEALRAGEIVHSIRNHLKHENEVTTLVNVGDRIASITPVIELIVKEHVSQLRMQIEQDLWVHINPVLLDQVILNLCKNGLDAMDVLKPKKRVLSVFAQRHTDEDAKHWVQIDVRDEGHGISAEVGAKIFNPFYTNKPQGMGVGLSLCRSVAEKYGGKISWFNNHIQGTTFTVFLPLIKT